MVAFAVFGQLVELLVNTGLIAKVTFAGDDGTNFVSEFDVFRFRLKDLPRLQ